MSQNYLASRSSNLSSFNAIAMNYSTLTVSTLSGVSTLNVSRVITTSTIQVNSSMISLGNSTNQVYVSSLSYGNFSTSTKWNTSMIDRLSTATIAMSANAQYQMTVSPSTTVSSIMYTSTLGQSWTTISAATGLPSATATSYTAGAISGDGQYAALGAYGGYLYRTANSGATWTNTNPNTPAIYLPLNGSVTDTIGTSNPSVQGTNAGSIAYVSGIVGTRAINFANATPGGTPTQYIRGTWSGSTNATISLWFNIQSTSITNSQTIFAAYQSNLYIGVSSSNMVYIDVPSGSSYQAISGPIVANNTWHNIVLIFQTNGLCSFYLNNQLIGTYTNTGIGSQATTLFSLGAYDNTITNAFNGYIDDFKIYNSAISTPPSPMVPQNWSSTAISNTGQYMLATATGAGLYMSSNFGATWTQVTGAMLNAIWSAAQISASGQYMLAYSTPVMVQPQLTGLTAASWQVNGITWTSNSSSVLTSTYQSWCAFNNVVPPDSSSPSYSWASAATYNNGTYTGSVSTTIISPGPGAYRGEWIQIQSSVPIVIYSYNFACAGPVNIPQTYFIIGSNDGANWYPIQSVSIGTNPFTIGFRSATSSPIIVNRSGSQTMTAGTSGILTCTTYTTNTTAAYTYFRFIANTVFPTSGAFEFAELYLTFQAGGQTYSTNYGSTWNNGYAVQTPTALSLSESGQYAIGSNTPLPFSQLNFEDNYVDSANGLATGVLSGTTANITFSATSMVGLKSLSVTNTAAGTTNLGYVNYTIPSGSPLSLPNALTIALWIRPNSTTGQSSPLGFNNGSTGFGTYFYLSSTMAFAYYTTTQQSGAITGTTVIPTGSWTHVALTFSGGLLSLYINGSIQASITITGSLSLAGGSSWGPITNMFIGCLTTNLSGYNGLIDDVRIYTYPLPASTINAMYLLSAPVVNITSNFLQGFTTGTSTTSNFTTPLIAVTNVPVASAVSNTGQYMVIITNNVSGNNVYYSTNFGALFTGLILGSTLLTSCAISYDGSYITVSNATTTWTLNNNSNGFSLALGNQAGYQNQGQNAIAIGNGAGSINQTANSIILNASPAAVNAFAPGFYVAPIATYVASSSQSFGLLGYGIGTGGDSQVVQIGNVSISSNILTLNNALSLTGTVYGSTNASAAFWMQANGTTSLYITDSQNSPTMGTTTMGRYFGYSGNIFQDFTGSFIWRTSNLSNTAVNNAMTLSSTGVLTVSNVSIFGNSANFQVRMGENCETGGAGNISVGLNIGRAAGTGGNNILYGASVGRALTSGGNNVLYGAATGNLITTGGDNTIFGLIAGNSITTGSQNTILGTSSGLSLTTGQFNTYLGYGTTASSGGVTNEIILGNNITGKGSDTCLIRVGQNGFWLSGYTAAGSISITSTGNITSTSDSRAKNSIQYLTKDGNMDIIMGLKPASYKLNADTYKDKWVGFIAQDLLEVIPNCVDGKKYPYQYKTDATGKPLFDEEGNIIYLKDENGELKPRYLSVDFNEIWTRTVLAIQEQQQQIVNQQAQIDTLIQRLAAANIA